MTSESDEPRFLASECFACLRQPMRCIPVFVESSQDERVSRTIVIELLTKHFWFQQDDFCLEHILCDSCWSALSEFDKFYLDVEQIRLQRNQLDSCLTCTDPTEDCISVIDAPRQGSGELLVKYLSFPQIQFSAIHSICGSCWNRLNEFHRFYLEVEQSHMKRQEEFQYEELAGTQEFEGDYTAELPDEEASNLESESSLRFMCETELQSVLNVQNPNQQNQKKIRCERCPKVFEAEYLLHIHMQKHRDRDNGKYKCHHCGKSFAERQRLNHHLQTRHGEGKFHCKVCGRGFQKSIHHLRHLRVHMIAPENRYKCRVCHKSFHNANTMRSHLRRHSGPEACEVCGEVSPNSVALTLHRRRAHIKNAIPVDCDVCGKTCPNELVLVRHKSTHNVGGGVGAPRIPLDEQNLAKQFYTCNVCGDKFSKRGAMTRHQKASHPMMEM